MRAALILSLAVIVSAGCDDSRKGDKVVTEAIRNAQVQQSQYHAPDQAIALLKTAANDATASPAARAHAKSLLAESELACQPDDTDAAKRG